MNISIWRLEGCGGVKGRGNELVDVNQPIGSANDFPALAVEVRLDVIKVADRVGVSATIIHQDHLEFLVVLAFHGTYCLLNKLGSVEMGNAHGHQGERIGCLYD